MQIYQILYEYFLQNCVQYSIKRSPSENILLDGLRKELLHPERFQQQFINYQTRFKNFLNYPYIINNNFNLGKRYYN